MTVPVFFLRLILAAWQKNWKWLIGIVIATATLKVIWSVVFSGNTGMSVIPPTFAGVIVCVVGFFLYRKWQIHVKMIK